MHQAQGGTEAPSSAVSRRVRPTKMFGLAASALLFSATLAACGSGGDDSGATGRPVVVALQQDVEHLDPTKEFAANATGMYANFFDTLTAVNSNGVVGDLAKDWTVSKDGKVWTFSLKDGIKFSNGEPLNADDVVFTFKTLMADPESPYAGNLTTLEKVEKIDETHVKFIHKEPRADWGSMLNVFFILPDKAYASNPKGFDTKPIGSGPYRVDSWQRDSQMQISANPKYWGDAPAVPKVTFRIIPTTTSAVSALQAGDVQIVPQLPPEQIASLKSADGITVKTAKTNRVAYLAMNVDDGILGNAEFRQAIAAAVDRSALSRVMAGQAQPNSQPVSPAVFGYDPDIPVPARDLDKAKALVQSSGYDGESIPFTYPSDRAPWFANVAQLIASQLGDAGIKVDLTPVKYANFLTSWFDAKKSLKGIYLHTYGPSGMDAAAPIQDFLQNPVRTSWSDPTVTKLATKQRATSDRDQRAQLISQLFRAADASNAPYVWLFTELQSGAVSDHYDWVPRADTQVRAIEIKPAS